MTWSEFIKDSLLEIAVIDPVETVDPYLQALALSRLNGILNQWNAKGEASYTATFPTYSTTSGLSPHTIGPSSATWSATQRPVEILDANRIYGSGTGLVRIPIDIRDQEWWFSQQAVPNIRTGIPTDLYYSPSFPNGSVYLWPVPDSAYTVELRVRLVLDDGLDAGDLSTDVTLPPGYQRALMLTLAEDLAPPLSVPADGALSRKASEARAVIFSVNSGPVRIRTRQNGVPGGASGGSSFNYLSRTWTGGGR